MEEKKARIKAEATAAVAGGTNTDTETTEEDIFQCAVYCHACWNFGVPPVSYMSWVELGRPLTASS